MDWGNFSIVTPVQGAEVSDSGHMKADNVIAEVEFFFILSWTVEKLLK